MSWIKVQDILHLSKTFSKVKGAKLGLVVCMMIFVLSSCNQLERAAKKLSGGLAELIGNSVAGVVEASFKIILLGVLDTQQNGTQLVAFEAETASGRSFKGVALGATGALESGEVSVQGKAFTAEGEALLLANGFSQNTKLPLVLIAVESDVSLDSLVEGQSLKGLAKVQLVADSLSKKDKSATVFRYIGETEKNNRLAGIGFSSAVPNDSQGEIFSWQADGDMRFDGTVERTSVGNVLKATTQLSLSLNDTAQSLEAISFAVKLDAD